jgi:hypothetical protein
MKETADKAKAAEPRLLQRADRLTGAVGMASGAGYPKGTGTFLIARTLVL